MTATRWTPDATQQSAVHYRGPVLEVIGAPGSGKTSVAVAVVADRVARDGIEPGSALVLAPTRVAAGRLRDRVTAAVGGTTTTPLARTPSAFAFSLLGDAAASDDEPPPRLLSGAEQDVVLGELLTGHREQGTGPSWPADLSGALATRGFRDQLRDLLMRAVEHGLDPEDLAALGQTHARPEWRAAAAVLTEYDQVTALQRPSAYDPAWICTAAADRLAIDPDLLEQVRRRLSLIVIDDAQELTASAARLIEEVHHPGLDVVLLGDGDVTGQGFRGADAARFTRLAERLAARSEGQPHRVVLGHSHRRSAVLLEASRAVVDRIGATSGTAHRAPEPRPTPAELRPTPVEPDPTPVEPRPTPEEPRPTPPEERGDPVEVVTVRTTAQEAELVAGRFREAHLGAARVPWSRMAVLARSRSRLAQVRRALVNAGVPVLEDQTSGPLHEQPVVRALLLAYEVVVRPGELSCTAEEAVDLVTSAIGGADPVALLRLRRELAARERAEGGSRPSQEVLAQVITDPGLLQLTDGDIGPALRVARVLAAGRAAAERQENGSWAPGVTAETVLWAIWSATGLAEPWRRTALTGGAAGARADRDLDAVMVLTGAAEAYVDRLPGRGPDGFLRQLLAQQVAPDTLVARARPVEAVEVLTPQAASGREWDVVAVVGVQEGVWPDLRLRDSLLGAEALVSVLHGREIDGPEGLRAAQAQVRVDEARQFYSALTRAREQLLVTAVASTEEQPSGFLDLVDPDAGERAPVDVAPAPTLRTLIARLRTDLVRAHRAGDHGARDRAATQLLRLEQAGVQGADPADWWRGREVSDDRPLQEEGLVPVSPSQVQSFSECRLRWLLQSRGGEAGDATASAVGTLVHDVVAGAPEAPLEQLRDALQSRWHELALGEGWVQDRQWVRAVRMLHRYTDYVRAATADGRTLVGVELELTATYEQARITGRVDRLERNADGALRVIDLKTGSSMPAKGDMPRHAQLGAYQVGVQEGGFSDADETRSVEAGTDETAAPQTPSEPQTPAEPQTPTEPGGAALVRLGASSGTVTTTHGYLPQQPLAQDEDPRWAHDMVAQTARGMAGSEFAASTGTWCRVCPVVFSCPAQGEGRTLV